mmetsp:Transcript_11101/g.23271  ORF Transcript_11101/g.23271 Transcript_11101/m.23271 type:complete len:770 (-) Transcript_11101:94-2403(-)
MRRHHSVIDNILLSNNSTNVDRRLCDHPRPSSTRLAASRTETHRVYEEPVTGDAFNRYRSHHGSERRLNDGSNSRTKTRNSVPNTILTTKHPNKKYRAQQPSAARVSYRSSSSIEDPPGLHEGRNSRRKSRSRRVPTSHPQMSYSSSLPMSLDQYDASSYYHGRRKVRRKHYPSNGQRFIRSMIGIFFALLVIRKLFSGFSAGVSTMLGYISSMLTEVSSRNNSVDYSSLRLLKSLEEPSSSTALGPPYVHNVEQIRYVLEVARAEYDFGLDGSTKLLPSVRDEERMGMYETIPHPGDSSIRLDVPQYYASSSIGEGGRVGLGKRQLFRKLTEGMLLTPELSAIVGTFVPSQKQSKASKSKLGVNNASERTIFVSLLSYGEPMCPHTVTNIFNSAANPYRVRVAVVDVTNSDDTNYIPCDQPPVSCDIDPNQALCQYNQNVDIYELDPEMNTGATFLRHIANRMYRGEYFAMQLGTNTKIAVAPRWDEELINQFEATNNEMAIITTLLSDARIRSHEARSGGSFSDVAIEIKENRITLCHASYERDSENARRLLHLRENQVDQEPPSSKRSRPMLQPFWSSEFSFSRGHFVLNVPYDPHLCAVDQQDEELSMTLRAFTHGYDFYTPTNGMMFRLVTGSSTNKGSKTNGVFSGLINEDADYPMCDGKENKSRIRLNVLTEMKSEDDVPSWDETDKELFGAGPVRQLKKFFSCFGVHVRQLITEQKLCDFVVSGNLHDEFVGNMRSNGMGIDYDEINFRFHELISIHKDNH